MTTQIAILGGESSGGILLQGLLDANRTAGQPVYDMVGFLNDAVPVGEEILGVPVLGGFEHWRALPGDVMFVSAIYNPMAMRARWQRIVELGIPRERWAAVTHPAAWVGDSSHVGEGCYISPAAVLAVRVQVGAHTRVGTGVQLGHHVEIGTFCFIGANATVNGRCRLGDRVHLGANSVMREGVSIGDDVVVGIGSAVTEDIPSGVIAAGTPARVLRKIDEA